MKSKHYPRPSAYLWARCEGWAKIGVFHAVILDNERGEVVDEKGALLLCREADGLWIVPGKEPTGMRYDRIAITHLPVDPWEMRKEDWQKRRAERDAERQRRIQSSRAQESADADLFANPVKSDDQ